MTCDDVIQGGSGATDDEKIQNVYDVKAKFVSDYNKVTGSL